jgi:hypothetical protein
MPLGPDPPLAGACPGNMIDSIPGASNQSGVEDTMDVGGGVRRIEMTERETPVFGGAEFGTGFTRV